MQRLNTNFTIFLKKRLYNKDIKIKSGLIFGGFRSKLKDFEF